MDDGEEERKSKGVFGVWNGFAFDGFGKSVSFCKRSPQIDELGIVASEGEVGVEKENAHEQAAQAKRGQEIGFALVLREVEGWSGCLWWFCFSAFSAFFVHDISDLFVQYNPCSCRLLCLVCMNQVLACE